MQSRHPLLRPLKLALFSLSLAGLTACHHDSPESMLASAKDYLAKKDDKAAVIQIKNALQKSPDLPEARYLLGTTLLDEHDATGAEIELRKALALQYSPDLVVPPLARSLVLQNQMQKVVDEFGKTALTAPEAKADLALSLSNAQGSLGNRQAAEASIQSAQAAAPDYVPAQIMHVRALATGGNFDGAIAELGTILSKHPENYEAWKLKGDLLVSHNQANDAIVAYRKSVDLRPDFVLAHSGLVSALMLLGKPDDANQAFEQMKKAAPKNPLTFYVAAQLAFAKKDYRSARDAVEQVLKLSPSFAPALQLAGAIELQTNSLTRAENYFERVLQANPDNMLVRRLLVIAYLREGQPAQALDAMTPVLEKIDNNAGMLSVAGEVYIQNNNPEKAQEYFSKASKLDPNDPAKRTSLAMARMIGGDVNAASADLEKISASDKGTTADMALISSFLQRKDYDKALQAIAVLDKKQPNNPVTYNLRARTLVAKNDRAGARQSFEQALKIDPTYLPSAVGLATLDLLDHNVAQAKKRFADVLQTDPKNVGAMLAAADLAAKLGGTPDEVLDWLKKAVAADSTNVRARLALADFYLAINDPKKAISAAQDGLTAIPDQPGLVDTLGRAQAASGDTNQALTTFGRFATLQPDSPAPYMRMAAVQLTAGQKDSAAESLRHALRLQPKLIEAQRALIALNVSMGRQSDALSVARQVEAQRPKDPTGYVLEGQIYAAAKSWGEAIAVYKSGLRLLPVAQLATQLHAAYLANSDTASADALTQSWLNDHPKDEVFRLYLADRANATKDYSTAAANYRAVLAIQPDNTAIMNNLAWDLGQMNDPKAMAYAETANRLVPNQPAFMDTLAMLLANSGDVNRALDLSDRATKLAPQAANIRLNHAAILIKAGKKAQAKTELEDLSKLGNKFAQQSEVQTLLGQL